MKNIKRLLLVAPLLALGSLAGCSNSSLSLTGKLIKSLKNELSIRVNAKEVVTMNYGKDTAFEREMGSTNFDILLTNDMYSRKSFTIDQDGNRIYANRGTRVDRGDDNKAIIPTLNPKTNEIMENQVNNGLTFDALFFDPFEYAEESDFALENQVLTLSQDSHFEVYNLSYIILLKNYWHTSVKNFSINLDNKNKPASFEIVLEDNSQLNDRNQLSVMTFSGEFVNKKNLSIEEYPTQTKRQDGQERLETLLSQIRDSKNFTAEYTFKTKEGKKYNANAYVTEHSFFVDYEESYIERNDHGYFDSESGRIDFHVENGIFKGYQLPIRTFTLEKFYADIFSYSGYVFNVNDDGSYSLPNQYFNFDFDLNVFDNEVYEVQFDSSSFSLNINSSGHLTYSYTDKEKNCRMNVIIKSINETEDKIPYADFVSYIPHETWSEMKNDDSFYNEMYSALDNITAGHPDDVPFVERIESTYMAHHQVEICPEGIDPDDPRHYSDWDLYVLDVTIVNYCFDQNDYNDLKAKYVSKIEASGNLYREGEKEDVYYMVINGVDQMRLEITNAAGFVDGMGQKYKYGIGILIDLVNIPEYVQKALDDFYGK